MYRALCLFVLFFFLACSQKPDRVSTQKSSGTTGSDVSITVATAPVYSAPGQPKAAEVKNTPPELTKIKIMPEIFKPGDTLYIEAAATDADGDDVTILYEWTKNKEAAGQDKQIGVPIKSGDKIDIKITPFDGKDYGRPIILHREIKNLPPMIIVDKNFKFEGNLFTYQVRATDPDDTPLTYSLKDAPSGMAIDKATGLIKWDVPAEVKGKVSFTASVSDGQGGEATQKFVINISEEKEK